MVCGHQVGLIRPDVITELLKYPEVFFVRDADGPLEVNKIQLAAPENVPIW